MQGLIKNAWRREALEGFERASIIDGSRAPEGLDAERLRFVRGGDFSPDDQAAHLISVLRGHARLSVAEGDLSLEPGVHVFLPLSAGARIAARDGTELVHVSGATARGTQLLVRDEAFLSACADAEQPLRWMLTPQYLSRRIFLHHDPVLLSKSGDPVSWFRTTMFGTEGLPPNQDGEAVFKMSYNSRTEFNVCYDVEGRARVRRALHPYAAEAQAWGPWLSIDGESTYHLDEARGGPEEEWLTDSATSARRPLRNKHEVAADGGHVTLFCLFDPAPTGVERHQPGAYSDYEPLESIPKQTLETHWQACKRYDQMVDLLSMAKARGELDRHRSSDAWRLFESGRATQRRIERALHERLSAEGSRREQVIEPWMVAPP